MRQSEKSYSMTAQQCASILGLSTMRIWQLGTEGKLRFRSVGPRDRLYDATSLAEYVVEQDMKCGACVQSSVTPS